MQFISRDWTLVVFVLLVLLILPFMVLFILICQLICSVVSSSVVIIANGEISQRAIRYYRIRQGSIAITENKMRGLSLSLDIFPRVWSS